MNSSNTATVLRWPAIFYVKKSFGDGKYFDRESEIPNLIEKIERTFCTTFIRYMKNFTKNKRSSLDALQKNQKFWKYSLKYSFLKYNFRTTNS